MGDDDEDGSGCGITLALSQIRLGRGAIIGNAGLEIGKNSWERGPLLISARFLFQVHPCGRYRHNTVVFILAKEHGLKNLRTIHRLDRLTSGLLLFGRNPKKARSVDFSRTPCL